MRARGVAIVGVKRLEVHLTACRVEEPDVVMTGVVLLVSRGHTVLALMKGLGDFRLIGTTLDDAAGAAFV